MRATKGLLPRLAHKDQVHDLTGTAFRPRFAMKYRVLVLLATLAIAITATVPFAGKASAATGYALDGQDPYATGCAFDGAFVVNTATLYDPGYNVTDGTAYLWYSSGCETNWVSVTVTRPSPDQFESWAITTDVLRQTPFERQDYTYYGHWQAGAPSWSNMVYAPVSCAEGYVEAEYEPAHPNNLGVGEAFAWVPTAAARMSLMRSLLRSRTRAGAT